MNSRSGKSWLWDLLGVVLVAAAAFALAVDDIGAARARGVQPFFYQGYYEPAVRMACDQPFEVDKGGKLPAEMSAFLQLKRDALSCESVPPAAAPDPNPPTRIWYHLLVTVAGLWKLTGITWTSIDLLASGLVAAAAVCVFAMFRLWMPWVLAAGLSVLSILPGLKFLLFLRDINKAPFILAALLVAAILVTREVRRPAFFALMASIGAVIGVGYGFRPDVLIGLPILAAVALFFRAGGAVRHWVEGLAGVAAMLLAFAVVASPIFSAFSSNVGSCHWHFAILGLSDTHTALLGLPPGSVSWLSHYDDHVVWRSVESYAERVLSETGVGYCTPTYDRVSMAIYLESIATLPGDFLRRALASAWHVIGYGFWGLPAVESGGAVGSAARALKPLIQAGWIALWSVVILALLARNLRIGLFACFALVYLCAYPIVQFDTRHYFHLAFLAWIPVGLSAAFVSRFLRPPQSAGQGSRRAWLSELASPGRAAWLRAVAIAAVLAALQGAALLAAFQYQERQVSAMLERYARAPGVEARVAERIERDGKLRLLFAPVVPSGARRVEGRMLKVIFGGPACSAGERSILIGFSGPEPGYSFIKRFAFGSKADATTMAIFMPVYFERPRIDQAWVELEQPDERCLLSAQWLDSRTLPSLWLGATRLQR